MAGWSGDFDGHTRKYRAPRGASGLHDVQLRSTLDIADRKHRAPKGALGLGERTKSAARSIAKSESTERQKVH